MAIEKVNLKKPEAPKRLVRAAKRVLQTQCSGEYESLRGTLVLSNNYVNSFDGWSKYFINKDGSGRHLTAFGLQDYPKGTFDAAIENAKKLCENKSKILAEDECSDILISVQKCIEESKDKLR